MNIVILGNPKINNEKITKIATALTEASIPVRYPTLEMADMPEDIPIAETFARVDWADAVIAIPKEGLTFGIQTATEIAYAKHVKKPVFVYYQ